MINEVLSNHKPKSWTNDSYTGVRYRAVKVPAGAEYNNVIEDFSLDLLPMISNIYRVQNPYLYGRFKLRKEQLQLRHGNVYEDQWYHPITENDKDIAMEYNCDYRRYTTNRLGQSNDKKPVFYKNASSAIQALHYSTESPVLVVMKVLSKNANSYSSTCTRDYDTEYYPEYIVEFSINI